MPTPFQPREKARISGADKVNPKRFAKRADPKTSPLGEAADWMSWWERLAWECYRKELPWLMESDRSLVEIACGIRARIQNREEVGLNALNLLRLCLAQMGASPADRAKLSIPDEPKEDPAEKYFN